MGRVLGVADSKEEAKHIGDVWWKAFNAGEKKEPAGYAGISWTPVADFTDWPSGDEDE